MRKSAFIIALFLPLLAMGQEVVKTDSVNRLKEFNPTSQPLQNEAVGTQSTVYSVPVIEPDASETKQLQVNPEAITIDKPSSALASWKNGMIVGGKSYYNNGVSFGNSAGATLIQNFGRLTITGNSTLSKNFTTGFGILNGADVNANLKYSLTDNVSVTGFGGFTHTGFMGPSPNRTNLYYGGYLSLLTANQKWGVDVGMRRFYNPATGMWTTVPIAMPYYNFNGSKLGFDLGGLLLEVFQGLDKALNHHHEQADSRSNGRIIMPNIKSSLPHFGAPEIPFRK